MVQGLRTLKHKLETLREREGWVHRSLLPWDCLTLYICWLSTAQCTWMAHLSLSLSLTNVSTGHTHYRKSHDMNSDLHPASALIKNLRGQADWLKRNITIHLDWLLQSLVNFYQSKTVDWCTNTYLWPILTRR